MVTVGSQKTVVSGVNGTLALNGNVYALAQTFNFQFGFNLEQEKVFGTSTPIINTAEFQGSGKMKILYSTEDTAAQEQFATLLTPVSGQVSSLAFSLTGVDVSSNTRKFTFSGTLWPQSCNIVGNGPSIITAELSFIFNALPVLT